MAPNGSMPAVNIPSFNNGVFYVNPFDPGRGKTRHRNQIHNMAAGGMTPSPQGSPQSRRVRRLGARSASSDVELADFESDFSAANREAYHEDVTTPKHRRMRQQASTSKPRPRFEIDSDAPMALNEADGGARRPSYMPTRGLAAVLNQGLVSLGEKLGKGSRTTSMSSSEALDMQVVRRVVASPSSEANNGSKKKSILKKSESANCQPTSAKIKANPKDPELENLLVSDHETDIGSPALARRVINPQLPPTTKSEHLKALTGPKLRLGARKSILLNASNNAMNNGNVASKEIQTSTASLLALAASTANNNINVGDAAKKFERGREAAVVAEAASSSVASPVAASNGGSNNQQPVFKCPNEMCRHNTASASVTASKRKICLCGRTMVNQSLLLESSKVSGREQPNGANSEQISSSS